MTNYYTRIKEFYSEHDKDETALHFGLSLETLNRYLRTIRSNDEPDEEIDVFPKILIVDIETAPIEGYVWGLWKQNVAPSQIKKDWSILGFAAKWLFEDKIYSEYVSPKNAHDRKDKEIMSGLWTLLDEADMVVAHNAKKFDIPRIDTRLFVNKYDPPAPYQVIDTLYYYKRQFRFSSNRLDYINQCLLLPTKLENEGMKLWIDCIDGKTKEIQQKGLDTMKEYNINDVMILEENYLRVRPWIKNHPNVSVYMDNDIPTCSVCGSTKISEATTDYGTPVNKYPTFRCNGCGAIAGRSRRSNINKEQSKNILRGIAR